MCSLGWWRTRQLLLRLLKLQYSGTASVASTEDRLVALVKEHLDFPNAPNFDAGLHDSGVSSVDAVAFIKKVGQAFGVEIPPEEVAQFKNLRDIAAYLDSHT